MRKWAKVVSRVVVGLLLLSATAWVYILVVGVRFRPEYTGELKALRAKADLADLSAACRMFHVDYGRWPASPEELLAPPFSPRGSRFEYLSRSAIDPWTGSPFQWRILPDGSPEFISLGEDRLPGGEGPAADIVVRP